MLIHGMSWYYGQRAVSTFTKLTIVVVESLNGVSVAAILCQLRLVASPKHFSIPIGLAVTRNSQKGTSRIHNGRKSLPKQKVANDVGTQSGNILEWEIRNIIRGKQVYVRREL